MSFDLRYNSSFSLAEPVLYDDNNEEIIFVESQRPAVDDVMINEAYCFDTERFAEHLVEANCKDAIEDVKRKLETRPTPAQSTSGISELAVIASVKSLTYGNPTVDQSSVANDFEAEPRDENVSAWPKISEFNIKLGLEKLEEYVLTWERSHEWLFCVEFLGFESEDCSNYFVYEVEWSIPTNAYPIPQATASIFFSLEVSKMVPHEFDRLIEVSYVFETSNVVHVPGRIDFQEKWLHDIIDAKIKFYKTITF